VVVIFGAQGVKLQGGISGSKAVVVKNDLVCQAISGGIRPPSAIVDHTVGDRPELNASFAHIFENDCGIVEMRRHDLVMVITGATGHLIKGDRSEDGIFGFAEHADLLISGVGPDKFCSGVVADNASVDDAGQPRLEHIGVVADGIEVFAAGCSGKQTNRDGCDPGKFG
jgi:hypothetical protein